MKRFLLFLTIIITFWSGIYLGRTQYSKNSDISDSSSTSTSATATAKVQSQYAVPILMYHYIRDYTNQQDPVGISLSISPQKFETQLITLKNAGYRSVSLNDLSKGKVYDKSIVFTFDDGYTDQYESGYKLLKQYGFTGTFFIIGNSVGKSGYMTEAQISEMKSAGMEIGGHSLSHPNLANTPYDKAVKEISQSLTGYDNVFAYPSGKYKDETLAILTQKNVVAAVTTFEGVANQNCNKLVLPRVRIKPTTDVLVAIAELQGLNSTCSYAFPTPSSTVVPTQAPTATQTSVASPSPTVTSTVTATEPVY